MTTVMTQPHSQPLFPDWKASYNPSLRWDEGKKWAGLYHNIAKYMDISVTGFTSHRNRLPFGFGVTGTQGPGFNRDVFYLDIIRFNNTHPF